MFSGFVPILSVLGAYYRSGVQVRGRDERTWRDLTRGEQIAQLLRLVVLVALAVTLVRAFLAFWDLCRAHDLPLSRVFYIPAALVAGFALAVRSLWKMAVRFFSGSGRGREAERPEDDPESRDLP
jgi:hypothetical protein